MDEHDPHFPSPIKKLLTELMAPGGLLSTQIAGFESREQQIKMLHNICDAYEKNHIALIEAGTGTGKSIAYLLPAVLWAIHHKERTVIATKTINLQEQLIDKDIPLLLKALGCDLKAVLVKGMGNYLCLRKFHEATSLSPPVFNDDELDKIDGWQKTTPDGSISSLPFYPSAQLWEQVAADPDACDHARCPHYQECYFFKARKQAQEAQLLVVNHHLLFADLSSRLEEKNWQNQAVLPPYQRVVLDEAHHIEETATEYFASRVSRFEWQRLLAKIVSDQVGARQGKLALLLKKMQETVKDPSFELTSLIHRLQLALPMEKRALLEEIFITFDLIANFAHNHPKQALQSEGRRQESKLRLKESEIQDPYWSGSIVPKGQELAKHCQKFIQSIKAFENDLKALSDPKLEDQLRGIWLDIKSLLTRLNTLSQNFAAFLKAEKEEASREVPSKVKWIESYFARMGENQILITADLHIAQALVQALFEPFPTVILASATLTTNHSFQFMRQRLGLDVAPRQEAVKEYIYDSPFNFQSQSLLVVPSDLPAANHPSYYSQIAAQISTALQASHGGAFVLFTSYSALERCYGLISPELQKKGFTLLRHGQDSRQALLLQFRQQKKAVLFGTDSFWEGVDVAGNALKLVILVKLPFQVPNEPLVEAKKEWLVKLGKDPFFEYSLPNAVVKFKQGFGRLIRRKSDYGCVLCLDPRLTQKSYGKIFLASLPPCPLITCPQSEVGQHLTRFYKYHYARQKKERA